MATVAINGLGRIGSDTPDPTLTMRVFHHRRGLHTAVGPGSCGTQLGPGEKKASPARWTE
jgi:hypothetical protein